MNIFFNGGLHTPIPSSVLCNILQWTYGELVEHMCRLEKMSALLKWCLGTPIPVSEGPVLPSHGSSPVQCSCLGRTAATPETAKPAAAFLVAAQISAAPWEVAGYAKAFPETDNSTFSSHFWKRRRRRAPIPRAKMGVPMVPSSEVSPSLPWPRRPSQSVLPWPKRLSSLFMCPLTSVSGTLTHPCSPLQPQSNQRCWQCWS